MEKINQVIDRIKILECPTGELENRVKGVFENYGIADSKEVKVNRHEKLDTAGAQAYLVELPKEAPIIVLAEAGYDDYVAKVVDAYKM